MSTEAEIEGEFWEAIDVFDAFLARCGSRRLQALGLTVEKDAVDTTDVLLPLLHRLATRLKDRSPLDEIFGALVVYATMAQRDAFASALAGFSNRVSKILELIEARRKHGIPPSTMIEARSSHNEPTTDEGDPYVISRDTEGYRINGKLVEGVGHRVLRRILDAAWDSPDRKVDFSSKARPDDGYDKLGSLDATLSRIRDPFIEAGLPRRLAIKMIRNDGFTVRLRPDSQSV